MTTINYEEIYSDILSPKLLKALKSIIRTSLSSKAFSYKEEIQERLKEIDIVVTQKSEVSFTNFKMIQIGLKTAEYLKISNLEEAFQMSIGIGAHEVGHIRFTSKLTWNTYGHNSKKKYKKVAPIAMSVLNIVEDRRIEYLISRVDPSYELAIKFMSAALVKVKEEFFENIDPTVVLTTRQKIVYFAEALIYASHTFKVPESDNFPADVKERLEKVVPYLMYSYKGSSTQTAVRVTDKIMEAIADWVEEINEDEEETKMEDIMEDAKNNRSLGTNSATEGDELEEFLETARVFSGEDDDESEEEKEFRKKIEKELNPDENESESNNPSESDDSGDSGEKEDTAEDEPWQKGLDMSDYLERKISEHEEILKASLEKIQLEPITKEILEGFMEKSMSPKKAKAEALEKEKLDLIASTKVDDKIHDGFEVVIKKPEYERLFEQEEYNAIKKKSNKIIDEAVKEIEKVKISHSKKTYRNRRKGKLDTRDLTKVITKNDNLYKKTLKILNSVNLIAGILVDNSGSNCAQVVNTSTGVSIPRYMVNQQIAVVMHEIMKASEIKHFVWAFDERGTTTLIENMIDFQDCFDKDSGLRLTGISANYGNRDGLAIHAAGKYLSDAVGEKDTKRLLIVISDGSPSAAFYYGAEAIVDVKNQIERLKGNGKIAKSKRLQHPIKTIGIFSGDEEENELFGEMYENAIYANGDSIFELPKQLAELIVQEFKN